MTNKFSFFKALLAWYDTHRRTLPWRALPQEKPNPYHVWLSEIMLQQTTVPTVKSYFETFISKWPTIIHLSNAPLEDILHAWQGLGYYRRAHNLYKCAQHIAHHFNGIFPSSEKDLLDLPGIGPYTAAAIAAIAFDQPAIVIDGNVERVIARFAGLHTPLPALKKEIHAFLESLKTRERPGDFAQAKMDLGSMICKPKSPLCSLCPLNTACVAYKENLQDLLPLKAQKKQKPILYAHAYWYRDQEGRILLEKRPDQGLLAGMVGFPSTPWQQDQSEPTPPGVCLPGEVTHTFTHFTLKLKVLIPLKAPLLSSPLWVTPDQFHTLALPTVMKKIANHALNPLYKSNNA